MVLDELSRVAVGFNDTGQSDYPRNAVNLKQTMDAPSDDDMRTLVGSACDGALLERRRRNLMTSRELSFTISCIGERLAVTAHELLSRIMDVASPSRSALPLSKVTLEHEADLLVSSLSAPPSVRVIDFYGHLMNQVVAC